MPLPLWSKLKFGTMHIRVSKHFTEQVKFRVLLVTGRSMDADEQDCLVFLGMDLKAFS
jgi:hypothetical protein